VLQKTGSLPRLLCFSSIEWPPLRGWDGALWPQKKKLQLPLGYWWKPTASGRREQRGTSVREHVEATVGRRRAEAMMRPHPELQALESP
jgi:hypothetical protein